MSQYMTPPVARYAGPRIDAHVHVRPPDRMHTFLDVAEAYGVRTFVGIGDPATLAACRREYGDRVVGILRLTYEDIDEPERFRRRTADLLRRCVECERIGGVKFWFKPAFNVTSGLYWDDSRLDPLFDLMVELRLVALIHIADPDIWFRRDYADAARYGTKNQTYEQLVNRMQRHPDLVVQAAHLAGHPEDLDHLAGLLEAHAGLLLDLSATKWLARELSAQADRARQFVIRYADRLLWGTDLVVDRRQDMSADDYATRYYVHRHLWEGNGWLPSPIHDSDAGGEVMVAGLDLPEEVLEKIYRANAERAYRIRAAV